MNDIRSTLHELPRRIVRDGWWLADPAAGGRPAGGETETGARWLGLDPRSSLRAGLVLFLIVTADALFYGRLLGIAVPLFLSLLALTVVVGNPVRATRRGSAAASILLVLGLGPLLWRVGVFSLAFGAAGTAAFAVILTGRPGDPWQRLARRAVVVLTGDIPQMRRRIARFQRSAPWRVFAPLSVWIAPLLLGTVFVELFSAANPVLRAWLSRIDIVGMLAEIDGLRLAFWLICGALVSGFVSVSLRERVPATRRARRASFGVLHLPPDFVARSLIVFNLVFAVQTLLDLVYLWGGAALPDGVSPAADAQEAAYILVFSALLAILFVLLAMRRSGEGRHSPPVRGLVYLWIGQNVVLVLSALLRLKLYVEIYALTQLRLAAFVWMILVAVGLILILVAIATRRSNGWLVRTNLVSVGLALYAFAVVDANALIANYNVAHSREIAGTGVRLDQRYVCSLGRSALPAIASFLAASEGGAVRSGPVDTLKDCANDFRLTLRQRSSEWRAWTYQDHRLARLAVPPLPDAE